MSDSFRSFAILAISSAGVAMLTVGLAGVLTSGRAAAPQGADGGMAEATAAVALPEGEAGGTLTVTGDREGPFHLTRESLEGQYALVGDDGRIAFEGQPVEVVQISYQGWEFFPDPDACTVTPGSLDSSTGIGQADLRCEDLADVRDNGVITLQGTIALPLDLLGESDLPPSGGSIEVGDEVWQFDEAFLSLAGGFRGSEYSLQLIDEERGAALGFVEDRETHEIRLVNVMRDGSEADIPDGACQLRRNELGKHNPRTTVIELTILCDAVDVPGLGSVPISGTVIVDQVEFPD